MNAIELGSYNIDLAVSNEQMLTLETWIGWFFVSALVALPVKLAYQAKSEIKGVILGRINRDLETQIPF